MQGNKRSKNGVDSCGGKNMNVSKLKDEELKKAKMDVERTGIASFRDVPTLRKLIAAFEDDVRESRDTEQESTPFSQRAENGHR
jgi:hypothetical protein